MIIDADMLFECFASASLISTSMQSGNEGLDQSLFCAGSVATGSARGGLASSARAGWCSGCCLGWRLIVFSMFFKLLFWAP
jgi:hypothetical protein